MRYAVYQQQAAIKSDRLAPRLGDGLPTPYEVNLVLIGHVEAKDGSAAIDAARDKFLCFRLARGKRNLEAFPIVQKAQGWY